VVCYLLVDDDDLPGRLTLPFIAQGRSTFTGELRVEKMGLVEKKFLAQSVVVVKGSQDA
jgi:hypothetical protein